MRIQEERNMKRSQKIPNDTIIQQEHEPSEYGKDEGDDGNWLSPIAERPPTVTMKWSSVVTNTPTPISPVEEAPVHVVDPLLCHIEPEWNLFNGGGSRLPVLAALFNPDDTTELRCFLMTFKFCTDSYVKAFEDYGLSMISDICLLEEQDWKTDHLKIVLPFHRKKIVAEAERKIK